jgi:putative phosphoribosyl transferase
MHPLAREKRFGSSRFSDRAAAGSVLADLIAAQRFLAPVVVTVPNGGVPVALPVANRLGVELGLCFVAKIPLPSNPPVGLGALDGRGRPILNEDRISLLDIDDAALGSGLESARRTLRARTGRLADVARLPDLAGRTCILVDDGLASGFTALAALSTLRELGAHRCIVASPVASAWALETLRGHGDGVLTLCADDSPGFLVDSFYADFADVSIEEVRRLVLEYARPGCALGSRGACW